MPSPTRNQSMRHLMALMMAMMGIFFCLIGLAILQTLDDMAPQPPKKRKKKVVRRRKKTGHAKNPPTIDPKTSRLNALPVELLMHIFEFLTPENVQPHLDGISLHAYKQAQKVLQNVCLVSKRMEAVARPFLYQGVIINNADTLAYFLRTLDENQPLGQKVKQLVFEVPCFSEDEQYQKPNITVLGSRPNFEKLQKAAEMVSNFDLYERECAHMRQVRSDWGWDDDEPDKTFEAWAWDKECEVFNLIHFEILFRTINLESLGFGMMLPGEVCFTKSLQSFMSMLSSALSFGREDKESVLFLSKLTDLQLFGGINDDRAPYDSELIPYWMGSTSLRTLKSFHDDGDWANLDLHAPWRHETTAVTWQCENITCIDLQRSHCKPKGISQMCTTLPALEQLSVSTDNLQISRDSEFNLSAGLAKLTHLRELVLDTHYYGDVKACLGPYGIISLAGLSDLVTLRLPLYFLVEMQPGVDPFIPDLALALPSSVTHLTVWANMDRVTRSGITAFVDPLMHATNDNVYNPRQSAVSFLESISSRVADHFRHLKDVTYCYGDPALLTDCHCDDDTPCGRCEASKFLDPYSVDDTSARMQILSSNFEDHGIRLRIIEGQV